MALIIFLHGAEWLLFEGHILTYWLKLILSSWLRFIPYKRKFNHNLLQL